MMPMTVQPTRDQLRALAAAATDGPWEAARNRPLYGSDFYSVDAGDEIVASLDLAPDPSGPQASMDADFIAASRTALPALLDALDQAEATIRRQERYIEELESVDAVGLKARAHQAEARIQAVEALCDAAEDPDQWPPRPVIHGGEPFPASLMVDDIRRALDD